MNEASTQSTGGAGNKVREATNASFRADVLTESARQPVLVLFWAPSSPGSLQMRPVLERLAKAAAGKIRLVTMNVEAHPQIAGQLGVQALPSVYAFTRGQPADGFVGDLPEPQVRGFVERFVGPLGSETGDMLAEADALAEAGDMEAAAGIYAEILAEEPGNGLARASLAKLLMSAGDTAGARAILEDAPTDARRDPAYGAAMAAVEIAEQAANVGDTSDLEHQIATDPKNHRARFDLALALNAGGQREEAADALLEIIRQDRKWEDDGARKQLVQFFESWGPMDAATQQARRKLSAMLFA